MLIVALEIPLNRCLNQAFSPGFPSRIFPRLQVDFFSKQKKSVIRLRLLVLVLVRLRLFPTTGARLRRLFFVIVYDVFGLKMDDAFLKKVVNFVK